MLLIPIHPHPCQYNTASWCCWYMENKIRGTSPCSHPEALKFSSPGIPVSHMMHHGCGVSISLLARFWRATLVVYFPNPMGTDRGTMSVLIMPNGFSILGTTKLVLSRWWFGIRHDQYRRVFPTAFHRARVRILCLCQIRILSPVHVILFNIRQPDTPAVLSFISSLVNHKRAASRHHDQDNHLAFRCFPGHWRYGYNTPPKNWLLISVLLTFYW